MNENEIPKRDFDKVLDFTRGIIESYRNNMTKPQDSYFHRIGLLTTVIEQLESIRIVSEKKLGENQNNYPKVLPVHRGYTVDLKLRQFRKLIPDKMPEFIPFNSRKGEALLLLLEEEQPDIIEEMIAKR